MQFQLVTRITMKERPVKPLNRINQKKKNKNKKKNQEPKISTHFLLTNS